MSLPASDVLAPPAVEVAASASAGTWSDLWRSLRRDGFFLTGLTIVVLMAAVALLAPVIAHVVGHGPNETFYSAVNADGLPQGPTSHFVFGADDVGRDVFVRAVYGARTSLLVAVSAALASTILGVAVGIVSGYYQGLADSLLSRIIDVFLSLPILLFAISISTVVSVSAKGALGGHLRPGIVLVASVIAFFNWAYIARIIRGQVLSIREREFVHAARGLGAGDLRIMWHEVAPNLISPILVYLTLVIPSNVLFESSLSYFGLGVPDSTPSWGQMLADATNNSLFTYAWWTMVFPGLFLVATMLGFNLVGDGLRDAFDRVTGYAVPGR